ncbi:unnamed protein product, partial [Mesorhabditis spiculigera]
MDDSLDDDAHSVELNQVTCETPVARPKPRQSRVSKVSMERCSPAAAADSARSSRASRSESKPPLDSDGSAPQRSRRELKRKRGYSPDPTSTYGRRSLASMLNSRPPSPTLPSSSKDADPKVLDLRSLLGNMDRHIVHYEVPSSFHEILPTRLHNLTTAEKYWRKSDDAQKKPRAKRSRKPAVHNPPTLVKVKTESLAVEPEIAVPSVEEEKPKIVARVKAEEDPEDAFCAAPPSTAKKSSAKKRVAAHGLIKLRRPDANGFANSPKEPKEALKNNPINGTRRSKAKTEAVVDQVLAKDEDDVLSQNNAVVSNQPAEAVDLKSAELQDDANPLSESNEGTENRRRLSLEIPTQSGNKRKARRRASLDTDKDVLKDVPPTMGPTPVEATTAVPARISRQVRTLRNSSVASTSKESTPVEPQQPQEQKETISEPNARRRKSTVRQESFAQDLLKNVEKKKARRKSTKSAAEGIGAVTSPPVDQTLDEKSPKEELDNAINEDVLSVAGVEQASVEPEERDLPKKEPKQEETPIIAPEKVEEPEVEQQADEKPAQESTPIQRKSRKSAGGGASVKREPVEAQPSRSRRQVQPPTRFEDFEVCDKRLVKKGTLRGNKDAATPSTSKEELPVTRQRRPVRSLSPTPADNATSMRRKKTQPEAHRHKNDAEQKPDVEASTTLSASEFPNESAEFDPAAPVPPQLQPGDDEQMDSIVDDVVQRTLVQRQEGIGLTRKTSVQKKPSAPRLSFRLRSKGEADQDEPPTPQPAPAQKSFSDDVVVRRMSPVKKDLAPRTHLPKYVPSFKPRLGSLMLADGKQENLGQAINYVLDRMMLEVCKDGVTHHNTWLMSNTQIYRRNREKARQHQQERERLAELGLLPPKPIKPAATHTSELVANRPRRAGRGRHGDDDVLFDMPSPSVDQRPFVPGDKAKPGRVGRPRKLSLDVNSISDPGQHIEAMSPTPSMARDPKQMTFAEFLVRNRLSYTKIVGPMNDFTSDPFYREILPEVWVLSDHCPDPNENAVIDVMGVETDSRLFPPLPTKRLQHLEEARAGAAEICRLLPRPTPMPAQRNGEVPSQQEWGISDALELVDRLELDSVDHLQYDEDDRATYATIKVFADMVQLIQDQSMVDYSCELDLERNGASIHFVLSKKQGDALRDVMLIFNRAYKEQGLKVHRYLMALLPADLLASYILILRHSSALNNYDVNVLNDSLKDVPLQLIAALTDEHPAALLARNPHVGADWEKVAQIMTMKTNCALIDPNLTELHKTTMRKELDDVVFVLVSPSVHHEKWFDEQILCHKYVYKMLGKISHSSVRVTLDLTTLMKRANVLEANLKAVDLIKSAVTTALKSNKDKRVVLVGWGTSTYMNHMVVQTTPGISALINFAFPAITSLGARGSADDDICLTYCPTLFICGDQASDFNDVVMNRLRRNMTSPTGLVIVHGGNTQLNVYANLLAHERVTQKIIERAYLEHIVSFLSKDYTYQPRADLQPLLLNKALHVSNQLIKPAPRSCAARQRATVSTSIDEVASGLTPRDIAPDSPTHSLPAPVGRDFVQPPQQHYAPAPIQQFGQQQQQHHHPGEPNNKKRKMEPYPVDLNSTPPLPMASNAQPTMPPMLSTPGSQTPKLAAPGPAYNNLAAPPTASFASHPPSSQLIPLGRPKPGTGVATATARLRLNAVLNQSGSSFPQRAAMLNGTASLAQPQRRNTVVTMDDSRPLETGPINPADISLDL